MNGRGTQRHDLHPEQQQACVDEHITVMPAASWGDVLLPFSNHVVSKLVPQRTHSAAQQAAASPSVVQRKTALQPCMQG
jgi:hypothetical protein